MYLIYFVFIWSCVGTLADFPGLRRPPTKWNGNTDQQDDDQSALLAQIGSMIEHHARMRLLQQLAQISREKVIMSSSSSSSGEQTLNNNAKVSDDVVDETPFIRPNDPRYYEDNFGLISPTEASGEYSKPKPMQVNPKTTNSSPTTITTSSSSQQHHGVIQKPINMDDSIGIYMVAMVAGISAAFTVAAISIGLAWYTLKKRIKAAADIEYPAYGVTGPCKDLQYEKKFAASVDMYHYQQQKQKKMSMEKQSNNGETNDGFSDLEGEYEMEDGDYTVYECPGLASTGEMEVKNPLFADEPITVAQKHQPTSPTTAAAGGETGDDNKKKKKMSKDNNISPKKK